MADEATLTALRAGANEWNKFVLQFTKLFPDQPFDLTDVDLLGVNFASIEFGRALLPADIALRIHYCYQDCRFSKQPSTEALFSKTARLGRQTFGRRDWHYHLLE